MSRLTLVDLLDRADARAEAIAAPDRAPLTFGALRRLTEEAVRALNRAGVERNDRVAIVLANGPMMATAFLAVAAGATTAPLNPAYRAAEFKFYLEDLKPKALLVEAGSSSPAIDVARDLGIAILELQCEAGAPAGRFTLAGSTPVSPPPRARSGLAEVGDIALVLHTSGTTSRPKIVPLSQANICASATNIVASLAIDPSDRCLNVMPLFHIHGLIAAVLASVAAGACVYCTPGFSALEFYKWLKDSRATWYTAVPTMHQAILARAERNKDAIAAARLRFVRSSSASLPPQVMAQLEATFRCPVIEAYGMTEASHQMASNPLPPRPRKPGSVGLPAGPQIAIMNGEGRILPGGSTGEIVIRGASVTSGYESNAKANADAFSDGWFRTGDEGRIDADGYLWVTGRLKEIINRGGEKISPREVDEVLLDHPAVEQAVTFAVRHDKLGEDVAAAIVLAPGQAVDERELRRFAAERLAAFKVPQKILFVDEIPKGSTGKLTRIGLAEKLGL